MRRDGREKFLWQYCRHGGRKGMEDRRRRTSMATKGAPGRTIRTGEENPLLHYLRCHRNRRDTTVSQYGDI